MSSMSDSIAIDRGIPPRSAHRAATDRPQLRGWSFPGLACLLAVAVALAACGSKTPESLMASGKAYLAKKDVKAAVIEFKTALQLDPHSAEARYLLGQALLDGGDPGSAVLELSKAADQKYAPEKVMPALSRALLLSGDYRKLTTLYGDMVLDDKPAMAALKTSVATAWGALGDKAKTEAAIAAALAAQPEYGPALILNARLLAGRRDFDGALALVDRILARDGSLYEAWMLKGEIVLVAKNDSTGAEQYFRKALELQPAYVPAHLSLIAMRLRERNYAAAREQADKLRAVLPKHPQTVYADAQIAYYSGNMKKARELTQLLLRFAPNNSSVLQLAGATEAQLGSLSLAESYFSKALQVNPDLQMARRALARTYLRLAQAPKALEALQPLLALPSPDLDTLALAGEVQLTLGDSSAAEDYFTRAAKIDPNDVRVNTAAALTRLARGDPDAAFNELEALSAKTQDTYVDQAIVSAHLKRREFDKALEAVEAMARKAPDSAAVFQLRGRVQLARRDVVAARAAFEQALKLDPALFAATSDLAALDIAEKKPEQAQKRFQQAIADDPRNAYARMALAQMRLNAGAPIDEVKALIADAVKAAPADPSPRLQLIDLLLKKRLYKDALAAAQEAAAALPSDGKVLDAVGRAQMEAGDVEQAIVTFRRLAAVDANPAQAYLRLADVYQASGKRSQAEAALRKAVETDPELEAAQFALVNLLLSSNRPAEAIEFARRMQKDNPSHPAGYLLEAAVQSRLKADDAAVAALKAGLGKNKDDLTLARSMYNALLRAGHAAEAERFGAAWISAHPQDTAVDYQLAVTNMERSQFDEAETRLVRIIAKRPDQALALNNLAWIRVLRGKPGAVDLAQRAANLLPNQPAIMDTLALALAADKQLDKALAQEKRAVQLAPNDNALRFNLARIALDAGDKALARQELERLQALGPSFAFRDGVMKLMKAL